MKILWKEFEHMNYFLSLKLKKIKMNYLASLFGYRNSSDPRFQSIMRIWRKKNIITKEELLGKGRAQGKEINISRKELFKLLRETEYYKEMVKFIKMDGSVIKW